ncbi:MAG: hypothetical protein EBY39_11875 [Flavobacteriia bacterium]|nr:hypothetical protein [Flavobacteriia bacterium]
MSVAYTFAQLAPSILAEPFIEFAETFGQDLNTLSRKEFELYCALLKSYQQNKKPSLSDFAYYGIRCKAKSEEEFSLLVNASLGKILSKLNSLISEDITSDIETLAFCFSGFEDGSVSNSFATFNIFDIELSTAGDKNILQQYFKSDSKMQNAVTNINEYIDSIDDDSVKKLLKNSLLDSDIISEEGNIVVFDKYAGYWSDTHCMPPELIYSCLGYYFESTFENKPRSRISQYEIDRKIFDPFFILSLYDMEPSHAVEGEYCGSVKKMYKKGSEVMSIGLGYTSDYFKNFFLQEKVDNLRDCMEFETDLMFGELGSRTKI